MNNQRFGSTPPSRHNRGGSAQEQSEETPQPKLWKAMHHPKWEGVHPEADSFFAMGKYKFAIHETTTPKSLLSDIKVGDRIVVQPRTMIGKHGNRLLNAKYIDQFRFGTITTESVLEPDQSGTIDAPLYGFLVDWDDSFVPVIPGMRNNPCKTFTLIQ